MGQAIIETILFTVVAFMTWRGLQTYGRRMEDEYEPETRETREIDASPLVNEACDNIRELQEMSSRVQAAFDETIKSGVQLPPDQFYCINTVRGPVLWFYNQPFAEQHYLEMHPYTEC